MAREKEGYRDNYARILEITGGALFVTVAQAAKVTGYSKQYVTRRFPRGWIGNAHGKRIAATELARQICDG